MKKIKGFKMLFGCTPCIKMVHLCQVDGIVYDNLHPNGIPFIEWINDLGGEGLFNIIRSIF